MSSSKSSKAISVITFSRILVLILALTYGNIHQVSSMNLEDISETQISKVRVRRQNGLPYPTFHSIPKDLTFTCNDKIPGYYSDVETECQAWHWCTPSNQHWEFLCPNQTLFNQQYRVCDWWYNVRCAEAIDFYNINEDLYKPRPQ